jgi:hypothetical protein
VNSAIISAKLGHIDEDISKWQGSLAIPSARTHIPLTAWTRQNLPGARAHKLDHKHTWTRQEGGPGICAKMLEDKYVDKSAVRSVAQALDAISREGNG